MIFSGTVTYTPVRGTLAVARARIRQVTRRLLTVVPRVRVANYCHHQPQSTEQRYGDWLRHAKNAIAARLLAGIDIAPRLTEIARE